MESAHRELRWLLQRNAELERALLQKQTDHERELAALRERADLDARRERERTSENKAENQTLRSQLAEARAESDAERARQRAENGRLQAQLQAMTEEIATLRRAAASARVPQAVTHEATNRASAPEQRERRCTPPRSTVLRGGGQRAAAAKDRDPQPAITPEASPPLGATPDPAPGTRTPRRRVKID